MIVNGWGHRFEIASAGQRSGKGNEGSKVKQSLRRFYPHLFSEAEEKGYTLCTRSSLQEKERLRQERSFQVSFQGGSDKVTPRAPPIYTGLGSSCYFNMHWIIELQFCT